jgi:glycine hydroxymethyltransferase
MFSRNDTIAGFDPELAAALRAEAGRQEDHIELIASENYASPRVMEAQGSVLTNKYAEAVRGRAHMTVNKNAIPNDPEKPFVTSGIRIGSPAMTTRGFGRAEAERLGHLIADVLEAPGDDVVIARVASDVREMCARFPVYGGSPVTGTAAG